ncbi:MAG TPA: phosphotransferase [Anaerolineales bacterium]
MITNRTIDNEALYLQAIRAAYPDLDIHTARLHTGEGQFNDVVVINDDLIFRFPRYEENIRDFLWEIEVLEKLQGHVSLPIPDPIYVSYETRTVGSVFMGYKLLTGEPLFRNVLNTITEESTLEVLAHQLADFLHGLHHLSTVALGLDLPVNDALDASRKLYSDIQEHLFPVMRPEARIAVTRHFEDYFNNPSLHEYEPVVIHGDFGGSNILFDGNRIRGIIDFSFAGLDDPARDIAAVSTYGEAFFARIRRHYPDIDPLLERAKFYKGTFALQEALHGFRNHDREAFESGMEDYV